MKIVFLDMDGVMNRVDDYGMFVTPQGDGDPIYRVDADKVAMFNTWAKANDITVVISSTWRVHMDHLEFCQASGIDPDILHGNWRTPKYDFGTRRRMDEIDAWALANGGDAWVALDDVDFGAKVPLHLIHIDGREGLQAHHLDEAREHLFA